MAAPAQLPLFGRGHPHIDASFSELRRTCLFPDAWFDYAPGWLSGHESVFERLVSSVRWRQERREMYERMLDVPRLVAVLPEAGPGHPLLEHIRRTLSRHYGEDLTRVSLGYYRNGQDSVAWHGDYVARQLASAVVATVSVGAPRRFMLRPKGGGASVALSLGWGDLLVMGGSCQRTWQHCVPKQRQAQPRISIMFRPHWVAPSSLGEDAASARSAYG
jgi:alkylated DNA repair dioxygenase AlkB